MVPENNEFGIQSNGNYTTCAIQGFFYVCCGIMSSCYNATLAILFVLMVEYRWTEAKFRQFRTFFLYLPLLVGVVIALPAIPLEEDITLS